MPDTKTPKEILQLLENREESQKELIKVIAENASHSSSIAKSLESFNGTLKHLDRSQIVTDQKMELFQLGQNDQTKQLENLTHEVTRGNQLMVEELRSIKIAADKSLTSYSTQIEQLTTCVTDNNKKVDDLSKKQVGLSKILIAIGAICTILGGVIAGIFKLIE